MKQPSIVHPRRIEVGGFTFEVVSCIPLSDAQALGIAQASYAKFKLKKKDKGKLLQLLWSGDEEAARLFGE